MKTAEDFAESLTRYWEFCLAFRSEVCAAIADRDAEWTAKVEELRAELETAKKRRDSNEQARALTAEARDKYASEANQLRAEVEAARARLGEAERLLREAPPHGGMTAYRDWLAMRDSYVAGVSATAAKYNAHLREFDALAKKVRALDSWSHLWIGNHLKWEAKVTALERVVKRIDTEHAEMCPQYMGLAAPPAPVAEPPMCYRIDCRYYGQRHASAHEPREPEAAGPVHTFVAGVGSVCWHYHQPKDGSAGFFCNAPPGNPIHATERK